MKRKTFAKRNNYKQRLHEYGFDYDTIDEIEYWNETIGYEFSAKEVDNIENATNELTKMCFNAVQHVIDNDLFDKLKIPEKFVPLIKKSWERDDFTLYGRFDLCLKDDKIKMYEFNGDTPTSLLEAALVQFYWKEDNKLNDQFNFIHEQLIEQWKYFKTTKNPETVYFSCIRHSVEDFRNTEYIMDTAHQAGLNVKFIYVDDIGSDGNYFYDLEGKEISYLFKLYPWEWLINENFADVLLKDNCQLIEPAWKMILSNKAILSVLWDMYPNHELLLETHLTKPTDSSGFVVKPLLSREGANVEIYNDSKLVESKDGEYGEEGHVYQELCELPDFNGMHPVIGSWVVGDTACGMGIREDKSLITGNTSNFVSNYF